MPRTDQSTCRCCDGSPLVGYWGLCATCAAAVERFLDSRRAGLARLRAGVDVVTSRGPVRDAIS